MQQLVVRPADESGLQAARPGYYDTEGTLRDTFFDTFLFLPCVTSTPSGGKTYRDNENPANLSDWRMFIDDVFWTATT